MFGNNKNKLTPFPKVENLTYFGLTANVVAQPGIFTKFGSKTVLAGQKIAFGIGKLGATDSREVAYIRIDNESGVQLHGKIRLVLSDPQEIHRQVVAELRTEKLSADQNDKTKGLLLEEYPIVAREDSLLLIEFYPDSDSAVTIDFDGTNTKMLIPLTVYQ